MSDYIYVNILNEGPLPWLRREGPLFGYKMSIGMLEIVKRDPRFRIEIVRSQEDIDIARKKYDEKKRLEAEAKQEKTPIILHDEVKIEDAAEILTEEKPVEVPVVEEAVEEVAPISFVKEPVVDEIDLMIDELIKDAPVEEENYKSIFKDEESSEEDDFKKYTEDELSEMTKSQMKAILRERGYTSGPYAGKYHDTVEILKRKVLQTQ